MKPNLERRTTTALIRAMGKKEMKVSGYAALFNEPSEDLGGFTEVIHPGAFDAALANSDVRALLNHDPNLLLGRVSSGTLRLSTDNRGLKYEIDLPDTAIARDLRVSIDRGDLTQSSFAFTIARQEWETMPDGSILQHIYEVDKLFDVSPVTYPAYANTEARASLKQLEKYTQNNSLIHPQSRHYLSLATAASI